jgi:NodT family efflux transporter outer membrane factor (OMF) lipoprotein
MIRRLSLLFVALLSGCSMTPHQERPGAALPLPAQFAEAPGWKPATPADAGPRGSWWGLFRDPVLDDLEMRAQTANQNIAAALAAYDAAQALVGQSRSALLPSISGSAGDTHSQTFQGNGTTSSNGGVATSGTNRYSAALTASWTPDLFGQLRETLAQSRVSAAATAADLGNVILAAQGQLALYYVQLRATDAQRKVNDATISAYARALKITGNRYQQGVVARVDVLQADTQLKNAQATATDLDRQRDVLVHAIAVLAGENPSLFNVPVRDQWVPVVPAVPAILPAQLLERRPDVAAAERRTIAANEGIGLARSAFFPTLSLSATASGTSSSLGSLFSAATSLWSLGGTLADTLLDFGGRNAKLRGARASYRQTVAQYRQTALTAFQQVEDQLAGVRYYETEDQQRQAASVAADRVEAITLNQYKAGIVAYTNVITAQTTAFSARQAVITATSNRQQAAVSLMQAIGGGWDRTPADRANKD